MCPGDHITFTCVVNSTATVWTVSPPGDGGECTYLSARKSPDQCGPDGSFKSYKTPGSGSMYNSSLSIQSVTEHFNGTQVRCSNGDDDTLIGWYDICITGKFNIIYRPV